MTGDWQIAQLCTVLLAFGVGAIFLVNDPRGRSSWALAVTVVMIGFVVAVSAVSSYWVDREPWWITLLGAIAESIGMIAGMEWGRRIALLAEGKLATAANWLFRSSQLLLIVTFVMQVFYLALAPDQATAHREGIIAVSNVEWAVFGPVFAAAMMLATVAMILVFVAGIDRAELVRLRAALIAAPFLIAALIFNEVFVPVLVTIGLIIFLGGSVRFLSIQGERGQFMSQFVSPDIAGLAKSGSIKQALQRERRSISVVVGDLSGFTDFARGRPSDEVADALERFYSIVGDVVSDHGGTIKDHAGDGVLILVGAPLAVDDHSARAATLSLALMRRVQNMLADVTPELGFSIGVATGRATVGAIRGAGRLEYVAVGNVVNLAARLCDRAKDAEILVDKRSYAAMRHKDELTIEERRSERLKGYSDRIPVYALIGING